MTKEAAEGVGTADSVPFKQGRVLLITSESLGRGSDELGLTMMRNFIFTMMENGEAPIAMFFINSGVKLCCEGSPVLQYLETLHNRGAKILSCGTCLNFYGLVDKVRAGQSTTMVTIVEHMLAGYQVVTI